MIGKLGKRAPAVLPVRHLMASRRMMASMPPAPDTRDWTAKVTFPAGAMGNDALGCHDAQTEVLTDKGWMFWRDYDGAALATMNQSTGTMEYQSPRVVIRYDYEGPMVYADHKGLDFALTPNHRMYNRPYVIPKPYVHGTSGYGAARFDEIQSVASRIAIPGTTIGYEGARFEGITIGNRTWSGDDFFALLGLILSDGWAGSTESNRTAVSFCSFVESRRELVASFAGRLGIGEQPSRRGVWKFGDAALGAWLRANACEGGDFHSLHKRIPRIVQAASMDQIERFLLFFGDKNHSPGADEQYFTGSDGMADDLQELLLKVGKRTSISSRNREPNRPGVKAHTLHVRTTEREVSIIARGKKAQLATDSYRGEVFCAEVPNSTLVTRRNGKILISGNCCTAAGFGHWVQTITANASTEVTIPDSAIIQLYSGSTGYNPADPSTDQGGVEADVLAYLKSTGCGGFKLDGFAQAQAQNVPEIRQVVNTFGGAYIGLSLPRTIESQGDTWDVDLTAGQDAERGSLGGHCVVLEGYDQGGFWFITWGERKYLTNAFLQAYNDEAWALLETGIWAPNGTSPAGDTVPALDADLQAVA